MLKRTYFHFGLRARYCFKLNYKRWISGSKINLQNVTRSKENIILMGSPGCGKTTVGRILSTKLGKPVLDIDDDHLEPYWGMPVSDKLSEVGSDGFVNAEGEALLAFNAENSVISLTGSNPMHSDGMAHIAKTGTVVFLDIHMEDIIERLERMKVNRIVGQNDGTSMSEILKYRQQFYERWYDARVICERNEDPTSVAEKVLNKLSSLESSDSQGYVSTRGLDLGDKQFNDVLLKGLADDGGLIVPRRNIPKLSLGQLSRMVNMSYTERALRVLEQWINWRELRPQDLKKCIDNAYNSKTFSNPDICPVFSLDGNQFIQELFHGPTASFKDIALQLMPQLFVKAAESELHPTNYLILVATSGDTGGAVLDGFTRYADSTKVNINVIILYPSDGISSIQRDQMIAYHGGNARVIGVQGADFDFCQTNVKKIFSDKNLAEELLRTHNLKFSAANSISFGRLIPQVVYHVTSYLDLVRDKVISMGDEIDLCVPTGNFGNILAAYYAKEMGIPYKRLICASNSNNILSEFLQTGCYDISSRRLSKTVSPAIDILVSSNLERLLYHLSGEDHSMIRDAFTKLQHDGNFDVSPVVFERLKESFHADWCSEEDCYRTIKETLSNTGYLMDPHTSVGKTVADRMMSDRPMIIASTAHPGKFAEDILNIFGRSSNGMTPPEMVMALQELGPRPSEQESLMNTLEKNTMGNRRVCDSNYDSLVSEIKSVTDRTL
ncbi:Threonine synthase-like 1 [Mactra antiquata]